MSTKKPPLFDIQLFKDLLNYIRPYKVVFISSIIFVVGLAIFGALRPYVLKEAVDVKISVKDYNGFLTYIIIMIGLLMLEAIFQVLFIYSAAWLGQSVVRDIRVKLFKKILSFKMAYYDKSSVGVLITRTVTDMERIADIFGQGLLMIVSDILKMTVVAGIMIFMNWKLSLIVFTTLPLILLATKIFQKYMKMAFQEVRNEIANLNSFVQERIVGMKILQVFSRETIEMERFKAINNKHKKGWLKTVWYNSIFFPIAEILSSLTLGVVIWFGGINSVVSNLSTQGELFAFIMMIPMMFRPLNQIANKFNTLQMGMVAADRVFKVLNTQSKISNKGDYSPKNVSGNIAFKKVQFSYKEGEPVINDFTLDIKSGETIAIVGATGAGKSTIISLLNRFYEIDSGIITLDGVDINSFDLDSLRTHVAVVLQDVFLFADTILSNISLNDESITQENIKAAAKEIGIHDFIESLPESYNYNVKERGVMLSSGQRQLISFLRAYVSNPAVLILDEATSSVDNQSEQLIQAATEKITSNRTSIVIAHRLATIKKADRIIVMDSGSIVEQGTHDSLMKKPSGFYKKLYEAQFTKSETIEA